MVDDGVLKRPVTFEMVYIETMKTFLSSSLFILFSVVMSEQGSFGFSSAQPARSGTSVAAAAASDSGEVPKLPEADPDSNLPRINLGETIRFEEMGPVILNTDGTTRRIANWDQMTEQEQKVTWRRISKRNEERRKILLEQQQKQDEQSTPKEDL